MKKEKKNKFKNILKKSFTISSYVFSIIMILFLIIGSIGSCSDKPSETKALDTPDYLEMCENGDFHLVGNDTRYYLTERGHIVAHEENSEMSFKLSGSFSYDDTGRWFDYLDIHFTTSSLVLVLSEEGGSTSSHSFSLSNPITTQHYVIVDYVYYNESLGLQHFVNYWNILFSYNGFGPSTSGRGPYVFDTYFPIDNFVPGVRYPFHTNLRFMRDYNFSYGINPAWSMFNSYFITLNYDNSLEVTGFNTTTGSFVYQDLLIGYKRTDKNGKSFIDFYSSDSLYYSINIFYDMIHTTLPSFDWLKSNKVVYDGVSGGSMNYYLHLNGVFNLAWDKFIGYLYEHKDAVTLGLLIDISLDFDFNIDGLSNNFNRLQFVSQYEGQTVVGWPSVGGVKFWASTSDLALASFDGVVTYGSRFDYYNKDLGLSLSAPYYPVIRIDSNISVTDYLILCKYITPVNSGSVITNIPGNTGNILTSTFSLIGQGFSGIFAIGSTEIFPGITFLTLALIPFFVFLIVAIIKLIKG